MRLRIQSVFVAFVLVALLDPALARPFNPDFDQSDPVALRPNSGDYVVLLHGMNRSKDCFRPLADQLHEAGYFTIALDYPALRADLDEVVNSVLAPAVAEICTDPDRRIHFVGHSLGSIVVRTYLAGAQRPPNLGSVVMLAPPNNGSTIIDALGENPLVELILGPPCQQLRTDDNSFVRQLPDPDYPAGVIMGNRAVLPFFRNLLEGDSDGIVPVEGGRLQGLTDFLVVHAGHTLIMYCDEVGDQVLAFLRDARFAPGALALR